MGFNINKTKLIVIKGYQDTGKTTTIWMVFLELIKLGAEVKDFLDTWTKEKTYPTTMPAPKERNDFVAELLWQGKRIVIISFGDVYEHIKNEMERVLPLEPDYVICAASCKYWGFSAWNLFENTLTNTLYDRVVLWAEHSIDPRDAEIVKRPTVEMIIKYIS